MGDFYCCWLYKLDDNKMTRQHVYTHTNMIRMPQSDFSRLTIDTVYAANLKFTNYIHSNNVNTPTK